MRVICLIILSTLLWQPVKSQVTLAKKDITCYGARNGRISVQSVPNATRPLKYQWSNGPTTKSQTNLRAGTYTVTVTDANGCTATASESIIEPSKLKIEIRSSSDEFFVCGEASIIVTALASGGVPPYRVNGTSQPPSIWRRRISSGSFGGGPRVLTFIAVDSNGCTVKKKQGFAFSAISCSSDPNDIIGPIGADSVRWVAASNPMDYQVRFENDPEVATAAASIVRICVPVPENINPFSFRLGEFGWGPFSFDVPENSSFYQQRLDLEDSLGIFVDVVAGLDIVENKFVWQFTSVDPETGQPTYEPERGFLPVNDTLTGSGEGFVNFAIQSEANAQTGDVVLAQAEIVFDVNESIFTNTWSNVLDALPPSTSIIPLGDTSEMDLIEIMFTGTDDPGGIGIEEFQLYASKDSGEFEFAGSTTEDTLIFPAERGAHYRFFSLGVDRVGNIEALKSTSDAEIYVQPIREIEFHEPIGQHYCFHDTLHIDFSRATIDSVNIEMTLDSGLTYFPIANGTTDTSVFVLISDTMYTEHAKVRVTDADDSSGVFETQFFAIHPLPVIMAYGDTSICPGEITFLSATGGNQYAWSPASLLNDSSLYNPTMLPQSDTVVRVTGIDVFGCVNTDSLFIDVVPFPTDTQFYELCLGDSVFLGGGWQDTAGIYIDVVPSLSGCDTIRTSYVTIIDPCLWAGGTIIYVDSSAVGENNGYNWEDAFTDLQSAISVAHAYPNIQEIWIAEGTYTPTDASNRLMTFELRDTMQVYGGFAGTETMRSERQPGSNPVQLSGDIGVVGDSTDNVYHVVTVDSTCSDCTLDGVTISWGLANSPGTGNDVGAGVLSLGTATLRGVTIEHNTSDGAGAALYNTGTNAELVIENCVIRLNTSGLSHDVINLQSAELNVRGSNVVEED